MNTAWLYGALLVSVLLNGIFISREYSRWVWKRNKAQRGGNRSGQQGRRLAYGQQRRPPYNRK